MSAHLRQVWAAQAPRERALIVAVAIVLGVVLYGWLVQSAGHARKQLRASVTELRAQATHLDQQAAEMGRLRAAPARSVSPTDLRTLVQAQVGAAGLSPALVRLDAPDANQVQVVFGSVRFAAWLAWVDSLQKQQVRLDACRIEALSTTGLVSVTATFVRPKPQ